MKIQVLYFKGCPNHKPAVELIRSVVPDATIEEIEVTTPAEAERLRFLGSPSILVDGVDVEPTARTRTDYGFSCRTYNDRGLPSPEMLRMAVGAHACCTESRAERPQSTWLAAASVVLAIVASACCWLPLLLITIGVSAVGVSGAFERVRPFLLLGTVGLLAVGFYFAYRNESCCTPQLKRRNRIVLWLAVLLALAAGLYPSYASRIFPPTSASPPLGPENPRVALMLRYLFAVPAEWPIARWRLQRVFRSQFRERSLPTTKHT